MAISILDEFPIINNTNDKNANIENLDKLEDEMIHNPYALKRLKEIYRGLLIRRL